MQGHYELGKWLRGRYDSLLPKNYSVDDIRIRSTDVDRTLMSAYSNLAGLYEPNPANNWSPNIDWQPIPVHTIPEKYDSVRHFPRKKIYTYIKKHNRLVPGGKKNQFYPTG